LYQYTQDAIKRNRKINPPTTQYTTSVGRNKSSDKNPPSNMKINKLITTDQNKAFLFMIPSNKIPQNDISCSFGENQFFPSSVSTQVLS